MESKIPDKPGMIVVQGGMQRNMNKNASIDKKAANVIQAPTFFFSPESTPDNWLLPRTRQELCFIPGTKILTSNGYDVIENFQTGDTLLSREGFEQKVTHTFERDYQGTVVTIKPKYLESLTATEHHPILIIKSQGCSWASNQNYTCKPDCKTQKAGCRLNYRNYKQEWVDAKDVEVDDFVVFPKYKILQEVPVFDLAKYVVKTHPSGSIYKVTDKNITVNTSRTVLPRFIKPSKELFSLLGWWTAEGSGKAGFGFALHKDEVVYIQEIQKQLKQVFNLDSKVVRCEGNNGITIQCNCTIVAKFFMELCGYGAENKVISSVILNAPKDLLREFLRSYFKGDGHFNINQECLSVSTVSKQLFYTCLLALSKLNILPTSSVTTLESLRVRGGKIKANFDQNCLGFLGSKINILFPEYKLKRRDHIKHYFEDENNFYLPIRSVEKTSYSGKVYNLETETQTYLAPVVVHNCKWIRVYFALEPELQSIITLHSLYPFSKPLFICDDEKVKRFYEHICFNRKFNLYRFLLQASLSYEKFGECIPFGNLEQGPLLDFDPSGKSYYYWKNFILLEPDTVEVEQGPFDDEPTFYLTMTEDLRKVFTDYQKHPEKLEKVSPTTRALFEQALNSGGKLPLDPESVSMIARLTDPSALRGTPILQCLMKTMIHKDWIRLAQISIAMRHYLPIEHWTIGDLQNKIIPQLPELDKWRELINQAILYPPFTLVTPPTVKYEALGASGKILPIEGDLNFIQEQILIGLGVNKNIILGEGISWSGAKTAVWNKLIMIYQAKLDEFTEWIYNRVFEPIAIKNNFSTIEGGIKKLIYPKIQWTKDLDPENREAHKKEIADLHEAGYVSTKTLFNFYPDLNYENERQNLEGEKGTIFDKKKGERIPEVFTPTPKASEIEGLSDKTKSETISPSPTPPIFTTTEPSPPVEEKASALDVEKKEVLEELEKNMENASPGIVASKKSGNGISTLSRSTIADEVKKTSDLKEKTVVIIAGDNKEGK